MDNTEYYEHLNITKDASEKEIKKAFRKSALRWHPDKNQDNLAEAEKEFKKIVEAHEVLSNPEKKEIYDKYGKNGLSNEGLNSRGGVDDIFKKFFGTSNFGFDMQQEDKCGVPDIEIVTNLTLDEIYYGKKEIRNIVRQSLCKGCCGSGSKDGMEHECNSCEGKGKILHVRQMGFMAQQFVKQCDDCRGTGTDLSYARCSVCKGSKLVDENVRLSFDIPPGIYEGADIIKSNEGNELSLFDQSQYGFERSNIVIHIKENHKNSKYTRKFTIKNKVTPDPANLLLDIPITVEESLCGVNKQIKHFNKTINIQYSSIIKHNDIVVIQSSGLPKFKQSGNGDLFIQFKINYNNLKLNEEEKGVIWELITKTKFIPNELESVINIDKYMILNPPENKYEYAADDNEEHHQKADVHECQTQ
jgi:DnaJ family protein A protein 2